MKQSRSVLSYKRIAFPPFAPSSEKRDLCGWLCIVAVSHLTQLSSSKMDLFEVGQDDRLEESSINVNKQFAEKYEAKKRREELSNRERDRLQPGFLVVVHHRPPNRSRCPTSSILMPSLPFVCALSSQGQVWPGSRRLGG